MIDRLIEIGRCNGTGEKSGNSQSNGNLKKTFPILEYAN